jgi:hypothetical protein
LCSGSFQIKTVEVIRHDNYNSDLHGGHVTIFMHTQHTRYVTDSEADIFFTCASNGYDYGERNFLKDNFYIDGDTCF